MGLVHQVVGRAPRGDVLVGALPAVALGVGVTGATTFVGLVLMDRVSILVELLVLAAVLAMARRGTSAQPVAPFPDPAPRWFRGIAWVALAAVALVGAVVWVSESLKEVHGSWDAWDFWNMRGRFLLRAGDAWERAFTEILFWAHPSYPPMLPSNVARGFHLVGRESLLVPAALSCLFTVASPLSLGWTVAKLRGRTQGVIAATTLLAVPYIVLHGADQYADTPLAFFFLATWCFIALHDHAEEGRGFLVMAGLAATLAALTKNEGIVFFLCVAAGRSWLALRRGGRSRWWREATAFATGALPIGAVVALFKLGYSAMPVTGEFYVGRYADYWGDTGPVQHVVTQVSDPARWEGMAASWWFWLTHFDMSWPVPLLFGLGGYGLLMGWSPRRPRDTTGSMVRAFGIQVIVVSGLFLAWSTLNIIDHMEALGRLLYQALPAVTLGVFLALRAPFETE